MGTVFTLNGSIDSNGETVTAAPADLTHVHVENLRSALASDDVATATTVADSLVFVAPPVQSTDPTTKRLVWLGATTVRPPEATELVVETYLRAGHQDHMMNGLVRGFQLMAQHSEANGHVNKNDDQPKQTAMANALAHVFEFAMEEE